MNHKKQNNFQIRLKAAMRQKKVTIKDVSDYTNLSYEMVRRYTLGQAIPRIDNLENIAKYLGVSQSWLQYGVSEQIESAWQTNDNVSIKTDSFTVDILDIEMSTHTGLINSDIVRLIKQIEYDSEQAKNIFSGTMTSNLKIVNIRGDSMQNTFESGDLLFVDISIRHFEGDGIYVFSFRRSIFVKRLQLIKDKLIVISDNKIYREWEIEEHEIDQLNIHAKVMFSQSMLLKKYG